MQGEEQEFEEVDQLGDNLAPVVGKEESQFTYYIFSADPDPAISLVRVRIRIHALSLHFELLQLTFLLVYFKILNSVADPGCLSRIPDPGS